MKNTFFQASIFVACLVFNACKADEIYNKITVKEFDELYCENSFVSKEIKVRIICRGGSYASSGGLVVSCSYENPETEGVRCRICKKQIKNVDTTVLCSVLCNHKNYYCHGCLEAKQFNYTTNNCTSCSIRSIPYSFDFKSLSAWQKVLLFKIRMFLVANEEVYISTTTSYIDYLLFMVHEKLMQNLTNPELEVALHGQKLIGTMRDIELLEYTRDELTKFAS